MPTQSKPAAATRISSAMQRYAAIPLRAIAGGGFVQHGWAKLNKGPEAFASILQSLHVPFPHLSAYLTISVELLGGAAFLFGAFIAWASVPAVVVLLIGERPGLATAESLSAYMAYKPRSGQTDADRNLISNIQAHGAARVRPPRADRQRARPDVRHLAVDIRP